MFVFYHGQSFPLTGALSCYRDEVAELSRMDLRIRVLVVHMIDEMTREMFELDTDSFARAERILEQFACYDRLPDGVERSEMFVPHWDWAVENISRFLGSLERDPNPYCGAPAPTIALEA